MCKINIKQLPCHGSIVQIYNYNYIHVTLYSMAFMCVLQTWGNSNSIVIGD